MLGTTVTPEASPEISMPLFRLPEKTLVRTVWLPPVEVIRRPSLPLGAAPWKASRPPKVLKVVKPLAVSATSMPFSPLPAETLPSGMTPPTVVFLDEPSTRMPFSALPTVRGVVGADAEEVGLHRGVVGVGDVQPVAAVAADHVVVDERIV